MKLMNNNNEIVRFLVNFFLLEVIGQAAVLFLQYLFRFFGMPWLYVFCRTTPHFHKILFTVLLVVSMAISIVSILRRGKRTSS